GGATPTLYGIFDVADLTTADKTYTLPDATGTVITTGNLSAITATGTITSGTWNATDIAVADGGTGASDAATARTNLGLAAGGAGDIWVEKAGDTMTGNLTFSDAQKIIGGTATTADLSLQTTSGVGAAGADMHFLVGNAGATEALTILNSGNVGIGTASPQAKLHVSGAAWLDSQSGFYHKIYNANTNELFIDADTYLHLRTTRYANPEVAIFTNSLANFKDRTFAFTGGNVGIGTTSPAATLDVRGDLLTPTGSYLSPYGGIGRYANLLVQTLMSLSATDGSSAPNGTTSADSLANTAAASGTVQQAVTITAAAAADYTFSVWLKAGTSSSASLDLTLNGTGPTNGASGTLTLTSSWQRFSVKGTTATDTTSLTAKITNGSAVSGQTLLAWGAQLEKVSNPGVYVRTTSSAVAAGKGAVTDGVP
ncbi:MAG: Uncharacterized protein FD129_3128, partial [bacterium]